MLLAQCIGLERGGTGLVRSLSRSRRLTSCDRVGDISIVARTSPRASTRSRSTVNADALCLGSAAILHAAASALQSARTETRGRICGSEWRGRWHAADECSHARKLKRAASAELSRSANAALTR